VVEPGAVAGRMEPVAARPGPAGMFIDCDILLMVII